MENDNDKSSLYTTLRRGAVYRVGVWRLQAFLIWRLASKGNISWRLASRELEASASTGFFDAASGVQRKSFLAFGVYKIRSMSAGVPKDPFLPIQSILSNFAFACSLVARG